MSQLFVNAESLIHFVEQAVACVVDDTETTEEPLVFARSLVWSDQIGRTTHGLWRLPTYLKRLSLGLIKCPCRAKIHRISDVVFHIDGNNGFGQYVGHIAMNAAIDGAARYGVGICGAYNSNHFGVGAAYLKMAADAGMIGLATSNSVPKMAAHGGVKAIFGTNPYAFGAPMRDGRHLMVDMATSASSGSMIMKYIEQGRSLPAGIAVDANGDSILDPAKVSDGVILPFGGAKGYGLALMVEILSGVITGACVSHQVSSMYNNFQNPGGNGHFFLALDISKFMSMDNYFDRMDDLKALIKSSGRNASESPPVMLPGENRWNTLERSHVQGVKLDESTQTALLEVANRYGIEVPW